MAVHFVAGLGSEEVDSSLTPRRIEGTPEAGTPRSAARRCRAKSRPVFDRPGLQGRCYRWSAIRVPIATKKSQRIDGQTRRASSTEIRKATRSHVFESPMLGEHTGEQHCCERSDRSRAGPQRSTDSVALAV
jgi:hypothetical protein